MNIFDNIDLIENHIISKIQFKYIPNCRKINKIFKSSSYKKFILFIKFICFQNFFENYKISSLLQNIKDKLYLANMFGDEDYKSMDTSSLKLFNKSIGWGINYFGDESWKDCFSFNYIIWNENEKKFLYEQYGLVLQ